MTKPKLGTTVVDGEAGQRDAFHVAAVLVRCSTVVVMPGANLIVWGHVAVVCAWENRNAIADPFLSAAIVPGEAFWALIVPERVSALTHTFEIDGEGTQGAKPALVSDYDDKAECRGMGCGDAR